MQFDPESGVSRPTLRWLVRHLYLVSPLLAPACTSRGQVHDAADTGASSGTTTGDSSDGEVEPASTTAGATTTADSGITSADGTTTGEPMVCGLEEADASLAAWESFREKASGAYHYVGQRFLMSTLPFTGPDCEYRTLIVVENGEVTRREMENGIQVNDTPCASGWVEQGADLGTHTSGEDGLPAPVWTLDEVYASCCTLFSNAGADEEPGFFADEQGLMERCFLRPLSCGDCSNGAPPEWGDEIRILEIGAGPSPG